MKNKLIYTLKFLVCLLLAVSVLVTSLIPLAETIDNIDIIADADKGYKILAQNSKYSLLLDNEINSISIADGTSGEVKWNSVVTNEICNLDDCSDVFKNYMQSMLVIHYALNNDSNGNRIDSYSADPNNNVKVKEVKNGADFTYEFTGPKIQCTLEVRLTEDGVTFNVPFKSVKEKGKYSLLSLEIAPFFGAAAENDDGYIFYPEGSGAITYFDKVAQKSKSATEISLDIYGDSNLETIMNEDTAQIATLPVYGIKRADRAFVAVITKGDADAKVNVRPAVQSSSMDINCAGFEFTYHYQYVVYLSNIVRNGKNSSSNINGSKVDKSIVKGDRAVQFFLLEGDKANYSGMANRYRKYLLDNDLLNKAEKTGYDSLALTILMGVRTEGELFGNNFVEMTKYSEAEKMVKNYNADGVSSMLVNLRGWSRSGYLSYPQDYSAVNALGGKKGIKNLASYLKSKDIPMTLECGVVYTSDSIFGIKGKSNLKGTGIPVADDEKGNYLLSPDSAFSKLSKGYKKVKKYGGSLALDDIGSIIYHNYNKGERITRSKTIKLWQNAMKLSDFVAVQNTNAYTFLSADWIYDIDFEQVKCLICDVNIPFVPMVLFGSVMLTSTAGNYAYDFDTTRLKWIEYGCSPYFELTEESPKLLRDTEYNNLFSSRNNEWNKTVVNTHKEFKQGLSKVSNSYITEHNFIADGVVKLGFENGNNILLNYNDTSVELEGKTVEAKSFLLY